MLLGWGGGESLRVGGQAGAATSVLPLGTLGTGFALSDGDILPCCLLNPLRKVVGMDPWVGWAWTHGWGGHGPMGVHAPCRRRGAPSVCLGALQGDAASHAVADLHPSWVLVLGAWVMQGLGEAQVGSSLLCVASEEQWRGTRCRGPSPRAGLVPSLT